MPRAFVSCLFTVDPRDLTALPLSMCCGSYHLLLVSCFGWTRLVLPYLSPCLAPYHALILFLPSLVTCHVLRFLPLPLISCFGWTRLVIPHLSPCLTLYHAFILSLPCLATCHFPCLAPYHALILFLPRLFTCLRFLPLPLVSCFGWLPYLFPCVASYHAFILSLPRLATCHVLRLRPKTLTIWPKT